jgi:prevent-host-death family protein
MENNIWQLQEAKSHFSALVKICMSSGPQTITVRGAEKAIMISKEDFDRLTKKKKYKSFYEFMRSSPLVGIELDLTRDQSLERDVEL